MRHQYSALKFAETLTRLMTAPGENAQLRKAATDDPAASAARWMDREDATRHLAALPPKAGLLLKTLMTVTLERAEQLHKATPDPRLRRAGLNALLTGAGRVLAVVIDWAAGDPQADLPPPSGDPELDCLEAQLDEMIAEMDLEHAGNEPAACLAQAALGAAADPIPGPLSIPDVAGCYNQLASFNFAQSHLAAKRSIVRELCGPGPVGV